MLNPPNDMPPSAPGRQQAPAGHPSTARAGPRPAGAQPAKRKIYPGGCLRATPVRMSGAGCPIWQRRFWSGHPSASRLTTFCQGPFDICAPTPSPEEKSGCKGKLQLQKVLCGLSSVSSFHRRRCDWMRCPIDEVCAFIAGQLFYSSRRTASGKPAG